MRYNANHEDARFVLNNGFMKLLAGLEKVELESLNFYSWAKRIMANVIIDEYRKNKNHKEHLRMKENESELAYFAAVEANNAESDLGVEAILKLLNEIPEVSAHVFTLYVMDGFSHKEIGDLLEITEGTSKWHLSTARKLLRDKLTSLEATPENKLAI
jgi:RNA polymerase sigma-70 factor (ECF subfamily)